jgi:predicted ABC-class ATPase
MDSAAILKQKLAKVDGKGYKAYRDILGSYIFERFTLYVDYVQADPFATPSRLRAAVSQPLAGFDPSLYSTPVRRMALEDFIARRFADEIRHTVRGRRGTGRSGLVEIDSGGQEILERTAAAAGDEAVEVRFMAGLPASGRRCLGSAAEAMLLDEIPRCAERTLYHHVIDSRALEEHIAAAEDQERLEKLLGENGLVAFVADGSVLPRESGVSERPLRSDHLVRFRSPGKLAAEFTLPNRGRVTGMGIPEGVTLIVGGGYHGKSTLLRALERAVYYHVPGDGRELVATRVDAVKIRAEDGRRVEKVDISPFISGLPFDVDTTAFSTENASGSTSQAANIVEALEAGSRLLLIDEDTSATNFMIRDELMQRLIPPEKEPITPLVDQVHNLRQEHGVSTVLVMGGSGDYFEVADTVIAMDNYQPRVVTAEAHRIASARRDLRRPEAAQGFGRLHPRSPLAAGIDPYHTNRQRVSAKGRGTLLFGQQRIDLSQVEQLVDESQTRAIGGIMAYARRNGYFDGEATLISIVARVLGDIEAAGLEVISGLPGSDYALPRGYEIAAALNRLRTLSIK